MPELRSTTRAHWAGCELHDASVSEDEMTIMAAAGSSRGGGHGEATLDPTRHAHT